MDDEQLMMQMMLQTMMSECSSSSALTNELLTDAAHIENEMLTLSHLILCEEKDAKVCARVRNYYEEVIPAMAVDTFRSHFRMNRNSMEELCREIAPHLQGVHKFERVPVEKKVLMTVWGLANQDVYRKIGNLFNTSRGGAQRCIMEVCSAVAKHLKPVYIKLPNATQCLANARETEQKSGFPGVCGCLDGTHIPVKPPSGDRDSYINRKGFASVNVLALCDNKLQFTYVYADRAGSVHDARVLRVSSLGNMLETGAWPGASSGEDSLHLLGDSAYPLLPNLLVPYRDNGYLTDVQRRYNALHSSTRSVVERAFGRLKGKFRRLKGIDATRTCNALHMIEAAFTLHNFILRHEEVIDDSDEDGEDDTDLTMDRGLNDSHMGTAVTRQIAKQKRDRIASSL